MACRFNATYQTWGWVAEPPTPDAFFPEYVLLDFCLANFFSSGNIVIPISTNVSLFRDVNGDQPGALVNETSGTLYGNTIYNYGWVLMVINNQTLNNGTTIPQNGTVLKSLYAARHLELSNRTQLWQSGSPGVQCQTITLSNSSSNTTLVNGVPTGSRLRFFDMTMTVFDQCNYDATMFIIVVASVGGAIIVATFIAAFVYAILAIKHSKEVYNKSGGEVQYKEMDRGE